MMRSEIESIRMRLNSELPGYSAHRRAVPQYRDQGEIDLDALKNPRLSGVLILLYRDSQGGWRFPLMKRQEYNGTHSGQVSLPGGRLESGDPSLIHTALRETEEEIGIPTSDIKVLGSLSRLFIPPSNFLVNPSVGFLEREPQFRSDPREVKELFTVPIANLLDERYFKTTDLTIRESLVSDIPYFDFNNEVVWGATAMILSEFRQVLQDAGITK